MGDRRGRLSVLFGSILLYSLANIANAFVQDVPAYAALRFIAGVGLAGELGAGITLVSEILPREVRGDGTTIVASVGVMGAVVAVLVGDYFDWRVAYVVGGVMGLALLILRIGVFESGLFEGIRQTTVSRGNFFALFASAARARRYLSVVLVGLPIWYVVGILITAAAANTNNVVVGYNALVDNVSGDSNVAVIAPNGEVVFRARGRLEGAALEQFHAAVGRATHRDARAA